MDGLAPNMVNHSKCANSIICFKILNS